MKKNFAFLLALLVVSTFVSNASGYYSGSHVWNEFLSLPANALEDYATYTVNRGAMFCTSVQDDPGNPSCSHVYWNSANFSIQEFTYNPYDRSVTLNIGTNWGAYVNVGKMFQNGTNYLATYNYIPGSSPVVFPYNTDFTYACQHALTSDSSMIMTNIDTNETCTGSNHIKLTVIRSPEGGSGVTSSPAGINCGINGNTVCQSYFTRDSQAELEACPGGICNGQNNNGWSFAYWDDGCNQYIDNPKAFTMSSAKTVTAVFRPVLRFPLSGTLSGRKKSHFFFSDTWTFGECPSGTYEKHVGIDLEATTTDEVYAAHSGTVKEIYTGQHSQWADAIVVEDTSGQFTTVYWHVIKYGSLAVNDTVVKGQRIATIANLDDLTHFHFGIRMAPFTAGISDKGALPVSNCSSKPAFPEYFIDPELITYE